MAATIGGKWAEEDTLLCRSARESGTVIDKATGEPMTFAKMRSQYDDCEPVRAGRVDFETFIKDKIEVRPLED